MGIVYDDNCEICGGIVSWNDENERFECDSCDFVIELKARNIKDLDEGDICPLCQEVELEVDYETNALVCSKCGFRLRDDELFDAGFDYDEEDEDNLLVINKDNILDCYEDPNCKYSDGDCFNCPEFDETEGCLLSE